MRYLGVDYGEKRIGVALSDESGNMAFPKTILPNNKGAISQIAKICTDEKVCEVVIGESLSYKGEPNKIMEVAKKFAEELAQIVELKVNFHPEILTTQEARRLMGRSEPVDASAAAIILQSYLDKKQNVGAN